jgi:hypothetical protein
MKGIFQQMREQEIAIWDGRFTKQDLDNLEIALEKDLKIRKEFIKTRTENEKALTKKSRELNKPIPFELAWHTYLAPYQTYVGSEFLEKYKEWIN